MDEIFIYSIEQCLKIINVHIIDNKIIPASVENNYESVYVISFKPEFNLNEALKTAGIDIAGFAILNTILYLLHPGFFNNAIPPEILLIESAFLSSVHFFNRYLKNKDIYKDLSKYNLSLHNRLTGLENENQRIEDEKAILLKDIVEIKEENISNVQKTNDELMVLLDNLSDRTTQLEEALITKDELIKKNKLLATRDQLTTAYNRYFMVGTSSEEKQGLLTGCFTKLIALNLKHWENSKLTRLFFDIDHFKKINDEIDGHKTGDDVLKEIVILINKILSKGTFLVRWGGDEFLIILPKTNKQKGKDIAEKIRSTVEKNLAKSLGLEEKITLSMGLAELKEIVEKINNSIETEIVIPEKEKDLLIKIIIENDYEKYCRYHGRNDIVLFGDKAPEFIGKIREEMKNRGYSENSKEIEIIDNALDVYIKKLIFPNKSFTSQQIRYIISEYLQTIDKLVYNSKELGRNRVSCLEKN